MTPQKRITYAQWLEQRRAQKDSGQRTADSGSGQTRRQAGGRVQGQRQGTEDNDQKTGSVRCSADVASEPDEEEKAAAEEVLSEPEKDPTSLPSVEYFRSGSGFRIGDIAVTPFTIPHDAADPVGFVFEADGVRIAIATDLGYMPSNVHVHLRRATC